MKKLNLITLVLLVVAAVSVTSCISNDTEDTSVSKANQKTYQTQVAGYYSGYSLRYAYDSSQSKFVKKDSIDASWKVSTDSTITIANFPVSFFANYISTTGGTDVTNLKTALAAASNQTITAYYCIPSTQYVTSTYIGYAISGFIFKLTYGGTEHTITIIVTSGYGKCTLTTKATYIQFITNGMYIDKSDYSSYLSPVAVTLQTR